MTPTLSNATIEAKPAPRPKTPAAVGGTPSQNGGSRTVHKQKKGRNTKLLKIAAVGVCAIIVFLVVRALMGGESTEHLTATVKRGQFDVVVVETGELQAERSRAIGAPMLASGGRAQLAIQFMVPEGSRVDSGALVVMFDPADQLKIIGDKQNELKLSMADLAKLTVQQKSDASDAQIAYENAKLSYELAKLSNDEMKFESESKQRESQLELKKAELSYKQAEDAVTGKSEIRKSDMQSLQVKIGQLQTAVDRAQGDLQRLSVLAPSAGLVVYQTNWSTGKKLTKGDQVWVGQPVIQLPDLSNMLAVLQVNEVDVSKVKQDQPVEVTLDAFPDKKFVGKVKSVASIGNAKDNNPTVKVFEVLVALNAADSVLKPGMTVSARISVSKIANVLSVPIESVFEDNGKTVVYVENGSSFDKRQVTLGEKNDNFVIVLKGLKEGEKVSLSDPNKVEEKQVKTESKPKV